MASDIVFDRDGDDSISLVAQRVQLSGRLNIHQVDGATPPRNGQVGDLVMTVDSVRNERLNIFSTTTRLWLCVPSEQPAAAVRGLEVSYWREVQLGPVITSA